MSDTAARAALSRMHHREQAIEQNYAGFANDMMTMGATDPVAAQEKFMNQMRGDLCEAYGFGRPGQTKPFAFAGGFAIIPVHGTLLNRFGQSYSFVTGYNFIRAQHNAAMIDPDVKYIVHDHNSYGGEAAGCFELADEIYASRGTKPIVAVVDSNCYSASYALATAADKIIVTPSSGVGSVGVRTMHIDESGYMEKIGIKVTLILAGDHKGDGNPFAPLPDKVRVEIQKSIDKSRDKFVSLVARNLGIDAKIVYDTQAATYRADEALELGLIHAIAVPSAALQSIIDDDEAGEPVEAPEQEASTITTKEQDMSVEAQAAAAAAAQAVVAAAPVPVPAAAAPAAAGVSPEVAERTRVKEILTSAAAAGRTSQANHLAFSTNLSAADAVAIMEASGKDAAPAPAPAAAANPFETAMANTAQPNITTGAPSAEASAQGDAVAEMLGVFSRHGGAVIK